LKSLFLSRLFPEQPAVSNVTLTIDLFYTGQIGAEISTRSRELAQGSTWMEWEIIEAGVARAACAAAIVSRCRASACVDFYGEAG
jgi:hypothetical protein